MIRPLYPVDLLLLFLSSGTMPSNQAISCDSLSNVYPTSPSALVEHWLPLHARRYTWLVVERGRALGLLSVRSCRACAAWTVHHLQTDLAHCSSLLDAATAAAAKQGVRKLFLRLPSDSPLTEEVRRCGFSLYRTDLVYQLNTSIALDAPASTTYRLRYAGKQDEDRLFDLYRAAVPPAVRMSEAVTFKEWQETKDRASWPNREFVLETETQITGWLRMNARDRTGCFEVLCRDQNGHDLEILLCHALLQLDGKYPIFCVAGTFQGALLSLLTRFGFEQVEQCSTLVKEIAVRVTQPHFIPIQA